MKNLKVQWDQKEIDALAEKCGINAGHMWGFMEIVLNESNMQEEIIRMTDLRRTFGMYEEYEAGYQV